ncbi:hypothetical protein V9K67_21330 [Paraflavisolibacter sp. H34]|uniref:hypothetical protein n=1 Tax=Huijunlia imazamoxiresistens TaxID=3127457 RepID=UPI0030184554
MEVLFVFVAVTTVAFYTIIGGGLIWLVAKLARPLKPISLRVALGIALVLSLLLLLAGGIWVSPLFLLEGD